tara:strand:- start:549 stop:1394 length:846 start_codon:yes stop_codon:yes gene_type:complete
MSKYFTVEVLPVIAASKQAAAFGAKDVLFDWTSFQVPRGANKLISVTTTVRGLNGATQTAKDIDLYFAKSIKGIAPVALGAINATMNGAPILTNHIIGFTKLDNNDFGASCPDFFNLASTGSGAAASNIPALVLEGEISSGDNVGYDTLYVGGGSSSGTDFGTNVLATGAHDVSGLSAATIASLDDGSGGDALATTKFAVGDIIHATGDVILGEILTIDSDASLTFRTDGGATDSIEGSYTVPADLAAWKIQNGAGAAGDLANNDELFNIHPMKLTLCFER